MMFKTIKQLLTSRVDLISFTLVAITVTLAALYYNFHPLHFIRFAFIVPILIVAKTISRGRLLRLNGSIKQLLVIFLAMVVSTLLLYGYFFYNYAYPVHNFNLSNIVKFIGSFLKYSSIFVPVFFAYILSSVGIGDKVVRSLGFRQNPSKASHLFLSLMVGFVFYGSLFFVLAAYSTFKPTHIIAAATIGILVNSRYLWSTTKKVLSKLNHRFSVELPVDQFLLFFLIGLFLATIFVSQIRSFTFGPDAARQYLVLIEYLAKYAELPTTKFQLSFPFAIEILLTPAYLAGGIPVATAMLHIVSMFYIFPYYLIARDYAKSYKDYWVLLPLFAFPQLMHMYVSQFKIDPFSLLIASAVIYLLYLSLKEFSKSYLFIAGILIGFAAVAKITTIWITVPIGAAFAIILFKQKSKLSSKTSHLLSFVVLGAIPLVLWLILYRITLPITYQPVGLGLSPRGAEKRIEYKLSECTLAIPDMEQEAFYGGFGKSIVGYLQIPISLIRGNSKLNMYSMLDIGGQLIITFPIFVFLYLSKRIKFPDNRVRILAWIALISSIPWLATAPILTWYAAPTLILTLFVINLTINRSDYLFAKSLVRTINIFVSAAYMVGIFTTHALEAYFPPNLTGPELNSYLQQKQNYFSTYLESEEVAKHINTDPTKTVLFSSSASFANINYYYDRFFDRAAYLDTQTDSLTLSQKGFDKIVASIKPDYLILNKLAVQSDWDCLFVQQYYFKNLFDKNGDKIMENNSYALYKLKTGVTLQDSGNQ